MPSFAKLFLKSKGKPIVYNGDVIQMVDVFRASDGQILKVRLQSVNSDWRQGVNLRTDGNFEVNNQVIPKSVVFWTDSAPPDILIKVHTKKEEVQVRNVWDTGDGVMHSWHNGAAMIVDVDGASGTRRYRCNDGRPDDDFDELIFSIEFPTGEASGSIFIPVDVSS